MVFARVIWLMKKSIIKLKKEGFSSLANASSSGYAHVLAAIPTDNNTKPERTIIFYFSQAAVLW